MLFSKSRKRAPSDPAPAVQPTATAAPDAPTATRDTLTVETPARTNGGITAEALENLCGAQPTTADNARMLSSMFAAHPGI